MKKGFTLLELVVVIIVLGILATLAITQYARFMDRARGAEAREILGAIRTNAAALYTQGNGVLPAINTVATMPMVGIGTDYPGPAAANCQGTNYFWYSITASNGTGFTALATRCLVNGKIPQGVNVNGAAPTVQLMTDFNAGTDTWTTTGGL